MLTLTNPMRGWMMDLDEKIAWVLVGCFIGYCIRWLQTIGREVHEVDEMMKRDHERDETGFARLPLVLDTLILILFVATLYSVFVGQDATDKANQAVEDIQSQQARDQVQNDRIEQVGRCNLEFTAKTIRALNERTEFTRAQALANVDILESQLSFLDLVLVVPPVADAVRRSALEQYTNAVDRFVRVSNRTRDRASRFQYPTNEEFLQCLGTAVDLKENP